MNMISEEDWNHYFHKWLYYYGGASDFVSLSQYVNDYDEDVYGMITLYDINVCPCVMCQEEDLNE
jgi:hypothetical protein